MSGIVTINEITSFLSCVLDEINNILDIPIFDYLPGNRFNALVLNSRSTASPTNR